MRDKVYERGDRIKPVGEYNDDVDNIDKQRDGIEDKIDSLEDKKDEYIEEIEDEIDNINDEVEDLMQNDKERIEDDRIKKEKELIAKNEKEKQLQIKLKGFEDYLESRRIRTSSNNNFAIYNVNWFNICCGIDLYDNYFESEVNKEINNMGITIDINDIRSKIVDLLKDEDEMVLFKKMIKSRLVECSEVQPPSLFDQLFHKSFGTYKDCDKRDPQSILYLYDEYRGFLKRDIDLSKLDRILILIYCETRQHLFSKYISLEILRRDDEGNKKRHKIISILDHILQSDKKLIKENKKLIKEKTKMKYEDFRKKRLSEINHKKKLIDNINNKITLHEDRLEDLDVDTNLFDKIKGIFKEKPDESFDISLTPDERVAYERAIKKMKGGNQLNYDLTLEKKDELCKRIDEEKNIYENQLNMVNNCFN